MVTEITYIARMRLMTASNQRDRVQAYWLAKSGTGIYQLILAANKQIGKNEFIQQFGLGDSLWQMVPSLNTGMMRMLFVSEHQAVMSMKKISKPLNLRERSLKKWRKNPEPVVYSTIEISLISLETSPLKSPIWNLRLTSINWALRAMFYKTLQRLHDYFH